MPVLERQTEVENSATVAQRPTIDRSTIGPSRSISYQAISAAITSMLLLSWLVLGAFVFSKIGFNISISLPAWSIYPAAALCSGLVLCVLSQVSEKATLAFGCVASFTVCFLAAVNG